MKQIEITIPEELTLMIQKYDYETQARRDIITYLLSQEDINISKSRFEEYQAIYEEKFYSFQICKTQLEETYIKPEVAKIDKNLKFNWSLNYNNNTIIVTILE